jgi:hypothetical protein
VTTTTIRQPCGPACTPACRAADAELHGARTFGPPPAIPAILEEDLVDHGHLTDPPVFTGSQAPHDIRAVQLRPENFSPAMIDKAGRLYHTGYRTHGPEDFEVCGESGEWYHLRVFGERVWFATCDCRARAGRYNRAGACAHRALAGYLRAQLLRTPIPKWPTLDLEDAS